MKRKQVLKLIIPISLAVVLTVALPMMSGCRPAPPEVAPLEPIKVGGPIPVTGLMAADGAEMVNGAILACEEINAAGGLLGRPLEFIPIDCKESQADILRSAAETAVAEGCDVLVTGYLIGPLDIHTFGKLDIPYLHADTTWASTMAQRDNLPEYFNCFAIDPDERSYGPNAFYNITQYVGYEFERKTAAILTTDLSYNKTISESFREVLREHGWDIVSDIDHAYGTTEYGIQLADIRAKNPGIIFFSTNLPPEAVAFVNQFRADPTDSIVYVQYCPNIPEFRELLGEKSNGILWQTLIGYLPPPLDKGFFNRYVERFGIEPGYTAAANTYDAIYMWAEAVKAVGDPKAHHEVCEYILENPYEGVAGTYVYDPVLHQAIPGNVGVGIPNQFFQIQNVEQVLLVLGTEPTGAEFELPPWLR